MPGIGQTNSPRAVDADASQRGTPRTTCRTCGNPSSKVGDKWTHSQESNCRVERPKRLGSEENKVNILKVHLCVDVEGDGSCSRWEEGWLGGGWRLPGLGTHLRGGCAGHRPARYPLICLLTDNTLTVSSPIPPLFPAPRFRKRLQGSPLVVRLPWISHECPPGRDKLRMLPRASGQV
jgi:hypothetical protein